MGVSFLLDGGCRLWLQVYPDHPRLAILYYAKTLVLEAVWKQKRMNTAIDV